MSVQLSKQDNECVLLGEKSRSAGQQIPGTEPLTGLYGDRACKSIQLNPKNREGKL